MTETYGRGAWGQGQFGQAIKDKTTPLFYKLWSCIYICDRQQAFEYLLSLESQLSKSDHLLKQRIILFILVLAVTSQNIKYIERYKYILFEEMALICDGHDPYYASLWKLLTKLLEYKNEADFSRSTNVIGDSHTLSISRIFSNTSSISVHFLPGITLRGLSTPYKNPYIQGFINALSHHEGASKVIVSVGEIDQREIIKNYQYEDKDLNKTSKVISHALNNIFKVLPPFADVYFLDLPQYDSNLNFEYYKNPLYEDQIYTLNLFREKFREIILKNDYEIVGNLDVNNIKDYQLDNQHMNPDYYLKVLNKIGLIK